MNLSDGKEGVYIMVGALIVCLVFLFLFDAYSRKITKKKK
jgi:hypothetical protein